MGALRVADFDTELVHFTPKQLTAEQAALSHRHTLYGGAAGGGKSYWLRWALVRDLMRWHATHGLGGVRVGLFCETYPALLDRQISRIKLEVPRWLGQYRDSVHELQLSDRYGAGVVCLRNLDDMQKYLSAEFAGLAFDELTRCPEETYDFLGTRLRWPGLPAEEYRVRNGTNPGGPYHNWVKRRFVDRQFRAHERASDYAFVPARAADNPHLPAGYAESLSQLPEALRQAYLEGRWDIFAGQVFSEWDPEIHVIAPFRLPDHWRRYRAIDYGYAAPSSVGWYAQDDKGNLYRYREVYEAGLGPAQLAEVIRRMTPEGERIIHSVADPALFKRNEQSRRSNAEIMAANGVPCLPGHNDRLSGWRVMHDYLKPYEDWTAGQLVKTARLRFFSTACPNAIRTIPALVYDEHRPEDLDTNGEDHVADEVRYLLMSLPALRLRPDEQWWSEPGPDRLPNFDDWTADFG
jgi:hypothetical protein